VPAGRHPVANSKPALVFFRRFCLKNRIGSLGKGCSGHDPNRLADLHSSDKWPGGQGDANHFQL
jgi:hypothetical protein